MKKVILSVLFLLWIFSPDFDSCSVYSVEIPDWASDKIQETLVRYEKWKGSDETLLFPLITDVHDGKLEIAPGSWSDSKMHLLFLLETSKRFKADFIADLGDIGLDTTTTLKKEAVDRRLESQLKLYSQATVPVLFAMGNHDHNGKGFRVSSKMYGEFFNGWTKKKGTPLHLGPDSDYGWYDIPDKKFRIIFLNTSDEDYYGFSKKQLQFLADALQLPEGYTAVVMEHFCILTSIGKWTSYPDTKAKRGELCMKILDAMAAGRQGEEDGVHWDFTVNRDTSLVGIINGDSHFDNSATINNVNYVVCQGYGGVHPKELMKGAIHRPFSRNVDLLIDVVAIKPAKKEFRVFRIGVGGKEADREFKYK